VPTDEEVLHVVPPLRMRFWKQILENFRNGFEKLSGLLRSVFRVACQLILLSEKS
jgi:hypothetical protein